MFRIVQTVRVIGFFILKPKLLYHIFDKMTVFSLATAADVYLALFSGTF